MSLTTSVIWDLLILLPLRLLFIPVSAFFLELVEGPDAIPERDELEADVVIRNREGVKLSAIHVELSKVDWNCRGKNTPARCKALREAEELSGCDCFLTPIIGADSVTVFFAFLR
ncbi:unnamed protein product [Hymenolepis diminuta]|uniref:Uncharacterized protein n=1 Tax=Hymenolepis diminuta TaxID=6216 RepID=A0A0R3SVW1_HYMDI|nr:unnamed protein product [Hymenolepis diminuta]